MTRRPRRWLRYLTAGVVVLVALFLVGPLVYDHVAGSGPAELTLPTEGVEATAGGSGSAVPDGNWNVGPHSLVGYRVQTDVLGYRSTLVGRTRSVWGSITVAHGVVVKGTLAVDLASLSGSASAGKVLDTGAYPKASLVLTSPFALSPAHGQVHRYAAHGDLTLHGATRAIAFTASEEYVNGTMYVLAEIPVNLTQWHVTPPFGVKDHGALEVLLGLTRGAGNRHVDG